MLQRLKNLYLKLESAAAVLSGRLKSHDQQLARLRAAVAALAAETPGASPEEKEAARVKLEGLLAQSGATREEMDRLAGLYESSAARVAAAEQEIADLRRRLQTVEEQSLSRSKGMQA